MASAPICPSSEVKWKSECRVHMDFVCIQSCVYPMFKQLINGFKYLRYGTLKVNWHKIKLIIQHVQGEKSKHSERWSDDWFRIRICWSLAYQNYSWCNVNDFSLFNIISITTYIYSYTIAMIPHMKDPDLLNSSLNPLRDKLVKLHN